MEPLCSEPPGDLSSKCKKEGRAGQAGTPGGKKTNDSYFSFQHLDRDFIWRNVIDFLHSTQNLECTGLHRGIPTDHMGQSQGKKEICWDLCSVWELLPHDYKRDSSQLKGSKRCPAGGQGCAQYILVSDELLINNTLKRFQLGSDVRDRLDKNVERERKSHTDKDKVSLKGAEVRSNVASAVSWN